MKRSIFATLVVLTACSAEEERGVEVLMNMASSALAPRYGEAPFPSDVYLGEDGRIERVPGLERVLKRESAAFAAHLSELDGFGLRPLVEMFVSAPIDPATLPARTDDAAAPIALVDAETFEAVAMDWRFDPARLVISGSPVPGVVLREGRRYAAILTRDVFGADGLPLRPLKDLRSAPSDRWRSTAEVWERLAARRELAGIAGIAVFTTQHATRTLVEARAILKEPALSFPEPTFIFDSTAELDRLLGTPARDELGRERWGWSNPTGIAHEHVGVIASGKMTAMRFVRAERGDGPEFETFDIDRDTGAPRPVANAPEIPVTFVLPKAPPPSAAGYPVVIFGHGLGASRHAVLTFAEPLAEAGYAIAAIDMDAHGSRYNARDRANNTAPVIAEFTGDAELADGFGDVTGPVTTLNLLHGFINLSAVRDTVRQSVLDLSSLAMLLHREDLDLGALAGAYGGVAPKLDASRLAYLGESYGGVIGSVFAAIEPSIDLYVLDVPGAGIIDLEVASSPGLHGSVVLFARSVYELEGRFDRFHPMAALAQAVIDGADPLSYAPHVLRDRFAVGGRVNGPRHVVAIEVCGDEIMSNIGTHALARAMGLPALEPLLLPDAGAGSVASPASRNVAGQTAVLVQYAPATHGANWTSEVGTLDFMPGFPFDGDDPFPVLPKPIEIANPIRETLEQVAEILDTHRADGAPSVRSVKAPIADFDGDGMIDDRERSEGRDPLDPTR